MKTKVAIVTGGASGIGKATVNLFKKNGMKVHAFDIQKKALDEAYGESSGVVSHVVDVSDGESVRKAVEAVNKAEGRVDILVNTAGIVASSSETNQRLVDVNMKALESMKNSQVPTFDFLETTTDEEFDRVMRVNVYSMFYTIQAVVPLMRESGGGAIVNFSSVSALTGAAMPLYYPASKAAVLGMTRAAAGELAPYNIRVNAIAPGAVDTPILQDQPDELISFLTSMQPIKRLATADELAETVLFLSDEEKSGFYTGQTICPNGGMWM